MKSMLKKNYKSIVFACLIYAVLFIVFLFNFFGADDYSMQTWQEWGGHGIKNGFDFALRYGNGRLLGNLALYYFNLVPLTRIILKPLIMTVLIACIHYVFEMQSMWIKMITAMLIIVPSSGFYASCYSINACFGNYVIPIANVFFCFSLMKIIGQKKRGLNSVLYVLLLLTSICMSLYCENCTIVFVVLGIFLAGYQFYSEKRVTAERIIFLVGGILGTMVMIILPKLFDETIISAETMSGYRKLLLNIPFAVGVVAKFAECISTAAFWIVAFGALLIYIVRKESPNDRFKSIHIVCSGAWPLLCLIYLFTQTTEGKVISTIKLLFLALMCIFLLNALVIFVRFLKSKEVKVFSVFAIFALAMSVGMFMFVNLHGYRTFYLSLFIIIGLVLYLLRYIVKTYEIKLKKEKSRVLTQVFAVTFACFSITLTLQTIQNYDVFAMRQAYVDQEIEKGSEMICIPKVPNTNLVRDEWVDFYKGYYSRNNKDIEMVFVDMEEWAMCENYRSMLDNPITSVTYAIEHLNYGNQSAAAN